MQTVTPAQFAHKMAKVAKAVKEQDKKAIAKRALVTKEIVTATAQSRSGLARKYAVKNRWVRNKPLPGDAQLVSLRGGFAHLAEKGSWRYPSGYDMIATNASVLSWGPGLAAASVKHPAQRAHPFWLAGIHAAEEPGLEAYRKEIRNSIARAVR